MTPREWLDFCATAGECWLATVNPDDPACEHTDILKHYKKVRAMYARKARREDPPTHTVREVVQPVIDALRSNRLEGAFSNDAALVCGIDSISRIDIALEIFGDKSNESNWMVCAADDAIEHYIETWFGEWNRLRSAVTT